MLTLQYALSPGMLGLLTLAMFLMLGAFIYFAQRNSNRFLGRRRVQQMDTPTVDDYVASHGEPEALVVLDATRSNELNAVVLVYNHQLIVGGEPVERHRVTSVTVYNAANPYVASEYVLAIGTNDPDKPTVKAPIGSDAQQANDVAAQLAEHLALPGIGGRKH